MSKLEISKITEHRLIEWYAMLREMTAQIPDIEKVKVGKLKTIIWSEVYGRNKHKGSMYSKWKDEMQKL